ncbi:g11256 [Coccomyxa elongata]
MRCRKEASCGRWSCTKLRKSLILTRPCRAQSSQCVESYQHLQPHRLIHPDSLGYHATISEPLFINRQLRDADTLPFFWEDWARQGLVRISHLRSLAYGPVPHDAPFWQHIQT